MNEKIVEMRKSDIERAQKALQEALEALDEGDYSRAAGRIWWAVEGLLWAGQGSEFLARMQAIREAFRKTLG